MSALSRKLRKSLDSITSGWLADESSDVESTYVAKPRYYHKRKPRRLVSWFAYITSDLQRLTGFTLILVLVCGLGTVALLSLMRSWADQRVITNAPAPDHSSLNPQSELQSKKQEQHEPSSRLPVVKPLAKSSERDNESHQKEAIIPKSETRNPKQESQADARPVQTVKSHRVSDKNGSSTNVVRAKKGDASRAKAVPSTVATKPSTNLQRPRRVAGRNDRPVPVATSGKSNKAKVIQWP